MKKYKLFCIINLLLCSVTISFAQVKLLTSFDGENGDYFGKAVSSAGDVNGDGYNDIIIGAPEYSNAKGLANIFFGGTNISSIPDVILEGDGTSESFGSAIAGAGDINGDGYDDIIVGAYRNDLGKGKAYIFFGGQNMDVLPDLTLVGEGDYFGLSVSGNVDINNDGLSDIIVGADDHNSEPGRVLIYFGKETMTDVPDIVINQEFVTNSRVVSGVKDLNGDGFDDILVGAHNVDGSTGRAYILFGGENMDLIPDVVINGESGSNQFGYSVSGAGDVNGDGFGDVIIGAQRFNNSSGRSYIFFGGHTMDNLADVVLDGEAANDWFGNSVSGVGDMNKDGYDDVIVGAYSYADLTGKSYIFYGGENMDSSADHTYTGEEATDYLGVSVSYAGDVNGDGFVEAIVGAYGHNSFAGKAYLLTDPDAPVSVEIDDIIASKFNLLQNYPNPFNPTTTIAYSVPNNNFVSLKVYDILGNEVASLVNEEKSKGNYEVNFDASKLASGIYVYRMQAGNFNQVKKMMLLK